MYPRHWSPTRINGSSSEGTQRQIMRQYRLQNLSRIVLSHEHLDHILGRAGSCHPEHAPTCGHVVVYGNPTVLERVRQMTSYIGRSAV